MVLRASDVHWFRPYLILVAFNLLRLLSRIRIHTPIKINFDRFLPSPLIILYALHRVKHRRGLRCHFIDLRSGCGKLVELDAFAGDVEKGMRGIAESVY